MTNFFENNLFIIQEFLRDRTKISWSRFLIAIISRQKSRKKSFIHLRIFETILLLWRRNKKKRLLVLLMIIVKSLVNVREGNVNAPFLLMDSLYILP